MPAPMTAQVATVRQRTSVPAKFQIAKRQATTATRMQALVVQKEICVTTRGLRKPLFDLCGLGFCESMVDFAYCGVVGAITRSARTGPSSVTAVKRNGKCRVSSPTHIRICSLSGCASSVVSDN